MAANKTGVIFHEDDYSGLGTRILIMAVDLLVLFLVFVVFNYIDSYLSDHYPGYEPYITVYVFLFVCYAYLTILKSSKTGTLGQILTKTTILNINGKRANIFQMTYRLLFWILGPFNFLFDFGWISLNKERRTLRDSICNTIVVRKNAMPVSVDAPVRNIRAMVFGFHFLYQTPNP